MCIETEDAPEAPPAPGAYVARVAKVIHYGHLLTPIERQKFGTQFGLGAFSLNQKIKLLLLYNRLDLIRGILDLVVAADPTYPLPSVADLNAEQGPGQIGGTAPYPTRLVEKTSTATLHNPELLMIHKHSLVAFLRAGAGTAFTGVGRVGAASSGPKLFLMPAQQGTVNRMVGKDEAPRLDAYPVRTVPEGRVTRVYGTSIEGAIVHKKSHLAKVNELMYRIEEGVADADRKASHDQVVGAVRLKDLVQGKGLFIGFTVCKGGFMGGRLIANRYASTSASQNMGTFGSSKRVVAVPGKLNSRGEPAKEWVEDSTTKYLPDAWMAQVRRVCDQMLVLEEDLKMAGCDIDRFCDHLTRKEASAMLWPLLQKRYWSIPLEPGPG